ncbi:MAG: Holliday junction resolvase RuvX [bacterium]
MSILGLDWGARFVGFATASPDGLVITPRGFFERKVPKDKIWQLFQKDLIELKKIVSDWEIEKIILGLPLTNSIHAKETSSKVSTFAEQLSLQLQIPVQMIDEHLTSWEAKQSTHNEHAQAAALILKDYFHEEEKKT